LEDFWDLSKVGSRDTENLDPFEMSMSQLSQVIREGAPGTERHQMALLEYHHRFALPVACLVMSLLGVSLGVQFSGGRKSWGMVIALIIFFVYFILYSATKSLGESGMVPVVPGAWAPNVLFGCLGVYFFLQTARETRFGWVERLLHLWKTLLENKRFSGFVSS
jgi:lipopolysaccharide export system permease protein